jgi:cell division protein FtsI (penicillin-binding protein 3)
VVFRIGLYHHLFPPSSKSLEAVASRQYQKVLELSEYRGTIFDRRQSPLAISIHKPSLFVNPRVFSPNSKQLNALGKLLDVTPAKLKRSIPKNRYFAWLKRKTTPETADRIMALNINGLYKVAEPDRYYPLGSNLASVIGYVGTDNKGLMGLERRHDRQLRGQSTSIFKPQDARGRAIFFKSDLAAPEKSGHSIILTIDQAIQEIAQNELIEGVNRARAKQGFVIVSDPHTGRILALANYPTFNPNEKNSININSTINHALADVYEPGSVIKPIVMAGVLEQGAVRADEQHFCENGLYRGGKWQIRDDHPYGDLDTAGILIHSSNICIYKVAKRVGSDGLYKILRDFGFATGDSSVDFPGQASGILDRPAKWSQVQFANIAFGQGMAVNGLEMVTAYGAIANGGHLMKPYLIDRIESSDGAIIFSNTSTIIRKVIGPETSKTLRNMLMAVVDEGTGRSSALENYTVGGKTGTSEKVDPLTKAYSPTKRIASFIGFTPISDPHLVIYVVIDEPGNRPYYGGLWAGPVFRNIAEKTLKYLNVAPDKKVEPASKIATKAEPGKGRL